MATPPTAALRIASLRARYAGAQAPDAVTDLSLELKPGRIYALLGPNGAGKTTLLRCLAGLLRPLSGSLRILGTEISAAGDFPTALLRRMGVLLESPGAYGRMTAEKYLGFFAGFYGPGDAAARIRELSAILELESLSTPIAKLSQGNRRKVQLMRSLLHQPSLVLWDEPTEHLDPRAQRLALDHLKAYVAEGAAALVTSHRLEQMEELADEYGFLRQGRLAHSLSRRDLGAAEGAELEGDGGCEAATAVARLWGDVRPLPPESLRHGRWGLRLDGAKAAAGLPDLVAAVVTAGGRVLRAEPLKTSLADLYRRHVEGA